MTYDTVYETKKKYDFHLTDMLQKVVKAELRKVIDEKMDGEDKEADKDDVKGDKKKTDGDIDDASGDKKKKDGSTDVDIDDNNGDKKKKDGSTSPTDKD